MSRQEYSKSDKLELLEKCAQWRSIPGNKLDDFISKYNVSKTSLYIWSKKLNIDINKNSSTSTIRNKNKESSFIKVNKDLLVNEESQRKLDKHFINIRTRYCNIEVPEGLSKESLKDILESLKEVNDVY